jgi:hypothetical protein
MTNYRMRPERFIPAREACRRSGLSYQRLVAMAKTGEVLGRPPVRSRSPDPKRIVRQSGDTTWTFDAKSVHDWVSLRRHSTGSLGSVILPSTAGKDDLATTKALASQLIGMSEDDAWSIVAAAGREWQDISGANAVTADLRVKRIRVAVADGVIRNATGG